MPRETPSVGRVVLDGNAAGAPGALRPAPAARDFVRRCLALRRDAAGVGALRSAADSLAAGWPAVAALVDDERLGPLLHRTVGRAGILPAELCARNHQAYRVSALRNRLLLAELGAVLRALAAARVEVIVLKGAALAETVYGDVALRPMVDLDLLIRPPDRAAGRRVLEAAGYAVSRDEVHAGALVAQENEIDLARPGVVPLHVDLHWHLFDSPHHQHRIDPAWFWDSAQPAVVAGEPTRILGPEAQLLHLCAHLALHHAGQGMLWRQDIVEVLAASATRLDWEELLARARRYDLCLPLSTVLPELADQWQAVVPPAARSALHDLRPSAQEAWLFARLSAAHRSAGQRFWTDLVSLPGMHDRWRFALSHLFPSADYMRRRYALRHPLLLPLAYPYRWLCGLLGR